MGQAGPGGFWRVPVDLEATLMRRSKRMALDISTKPSGGQSRIRRVQLASEGAGRFQRVPASSGGFACTVKVLKKAPGVRHLD